MSKLVTVMGGSETLLTMGSKEIATLVGKRHDNVVRDIRKMVSELDASDLRQVEIVQDSQGRTAEYKLPRREVDILLTGYSTPLRAKVIDRWRELEAEVVRPVNLSDESALRGLLLGYTEQVLQLEHKIEVDKPKVEFYDVMVDSKELKPVITIAKTLKTGQNRLFKYMRDNNILMSEGDNKNIPYQQHQDAGRFHVKWDKYQVPETGEIKVTGRTYFTGKGILWIQQYIEQHGRAGLDKE